MFTGNCTPYCVQTSSACEPGCTPRVLFRPDSLEVSLVGNVLSRLKFGIGYDKIASIREREIIFSLGRRWTEHTYLDTVRPGRAPEEGNVSEDKSDTECFEKREAAKRGLASGCYCYYYAELLPAKLPLLQAERSDMDTGCRRDSDCIVRHQSEKERQPTMAAVWLEL